MNGKKLVWTVVAAALGSSPVFAAGGDAFLQPQKAAEILTDGVAWSASSPTGRSFELTLKKNGSGTIRGALPVPLTVGWSVKGDAFCISGTMMSKCLRFKQIPGGLEGWEGNKPDLTLRR